MGRFARCGNDDPESFFPGGKRKVPDAFRGAVGGHDAGFTGDAEGGQPFLGFLYHGVVAAAPHDEGNFYYFSHDENRVTQNEKKGQTDDSNPAHK
jgi:hypothetical protein